MESRELRIGNIINDCLTVTAIDSGYIRTLNKYRNPAGIFIDEARPIPLTEEILLKCGFVRIPNGYEFTNGKLTVLPCMHGKEFLLTLDVNCVHKGVQRIKSLHQLQNLYFALTGEELEVKL